MSLHLLEMGDSEPEEAELTEGFIIFFCKTEGFIIFSSQNYPITSAPPLPAPKESYIIFPFDSEFVVRKVLFFPLSSPYTYMGQNMK